MRQPKITPAPFSHIPLGPGRWVTLGSAIGRGSMAHVYEGIIDGNFGVQRRCAVKVFHVVATDEQEAVLGALIETTKKSACIDHPNVAATIEFGVHAGQPFRICELVTGPSLRALVDRFRVQRLRMPLDLALFIALDVAEALDAARVSKDDMGNDLRFVHGDLSPRDVLLSKHGLVKVTDFGLWAARHMASDVRNIRHLAKRTESMSPEVARGRTPDAKSDVFSLGLLLHEMLVGPRFSTPANEQEALLRARDGFIEAVGVGPHLPRALQDALLRALAIDPRDRFPTPAALGFELRRIALSLGVGDLRVVLRTTLESMFQEDISGATRPSFMAPVQPREARDHRDPRAPRDDARADAKADQRDTQRPRRQESGAVVRQLRAAASPSCTRGEAEEVFLDAEELDDADLEWEGYVEDHWPR